MAKIFIAEIKPHQDIVSSFVVTEKQLRVTRTGSSFVTLRLVDKTGDVVGRIWENAEDLEQTIPVGEAVSIHARSETYKGELQLNIQQVTPLDRAQVDPADFLPVCPQDLNILFQQLKRIVASLKTIPLRQLMQAILDDRPLLERFKRAPAAKSVHHAYLGGLLEHSVSVANLAVLIAKQYESLNRDVLVVGALLHDIGKIDEYRYDLAIDYSDSGRLLGHMIQGLQIVEDKVRSIPGFPSELAMVIKHLILSHHGEHDFGAVKLPMTREAFVLHIADDLDAKMHMLGHILDGSTVDADLWTAYQPMFQRFFYRGMAAGSSDGATQDAQQSASGIQLSLWNSEAPRNTVP